MGFGYGYRFFRVFGYGYGYGCGIFCLFGCGCGFGYNNPHLGPIHTKYSFDLTADGLIRQVYGDKAREFVEGLKRSPAVAVPLVLKRLRAKDEEWREAKRALERQWGEQIERNYLKSLDHCAAPFKQNDQKQLKAKSLIGEIEEAKEDALAAAAAAATHLAGGSLVSGMGWGLGRLVR